MATRFALLRFWENVAANQRVDHAAQILGEIGLEPERVRMINVSAAMGEQFVIEVTNLVEAVESLGPSPLSTVADKSRTMLTPKETSHDCR